MVEQTQPIPKKHFGTTTLGKTNNNDLLIGI